MKMSCALYPYGILDAPFYQSDGFWNVSSCDCGLLRSLTRGNLESWPFTDSA